MTPLQLSIEEAELHSLWLLPLARQRIDACVEVSQELVSRGHFSRDDGGVELPPPQRHHMHKYDYPYGSRCALHACTK
eukprot:CAMPEP_0183351256 /NCGR_PEP_ID=MMETSP0164_2-20130417/23450_1 /TAXON_ID=221442 /ORGANISM="Coccolithus pelagicus ssp braarudi, Strain PLY182g" /LENGTH=77 /DNA_ID=CAMNT_0025523377 /DNA_START=460 /DNA_END=690 /DNA_ORIENTATION=-